jgi:hypothetical protein
MVGSKLGRGHGRKRFHSLPPFRAPDAPIPVAYSWRPHAIKASREGGVADTIPFNNAAERAIGPLALGRKNYLFAGSDEGGRRAAILYTLVETARLNGVDPEAWLADTISRIADRPISKIDELLPWKWSRAASRAIAA